MTRFERDYRDAQETGGVEIILRRRKELANLIEQGRACKYKFRMECIAQDVARLTAELEAIENLF